MQEEHIGILSGLEIPKNRISKEHYYPKSKLPEIVAQNPYNIFEEHKILNNIKSNMLPCIWEEQKWETCYRATVYYTLKANDKDFIQKAMRNWLDFKINPCEYCIAARNEYREFCVKNNIFQQLKQR